MGIFSGIKEALVVLDIIKNNGLVGEKIHFDDNVKYTDERGEIHQVEYVIQKDYFSSYISLMVCVNGEEKKMMHSLMPIVTLVYLKMQEYERNFK